MSVAAAYAKVNEFMLAKERAKEQAFEAPQLPAAYTHLPRAHVAPREDVVALEGEAYWWQLQVTKFMARITAADYDTLTPREQSRLRISLLNAQTQLRVHTGTTLPTTKPKMHRTKGDHHASMSWTA